jgi:hypothetical protein
MSSLRARTGPLCATALVAALTGCATSGLSSETPPGVRLAGDWKLDPAHSDDLGKAVEQLRAQDRKGRHKARTPQPQDAQGPASGHRRMHRGGSAGQQGQGTENGDSVLGPGEEADAGPPRSSPVDELMSSVPRGDYLKITVGPNAFMVTSGGSADQYTPGLVSDISAEQGDAQQISGWKGTNYLIDTKPQWGPEIIQTYSLSTDGSLTMTVRLTGGRTKLTFTRVYARTKGVAPLAPPTNN